MTNAASTPGNTPELFFCATLQPAPEGPRHPRAEMIGSDETRELSLSLGVVASDVLARPKASGLNARALPRHWRETTGWTRCASTSLVISPKHLISVRVADEIVDRSSRFSFGSLSSHIMFSLHLSVSNPCLPLAGLARPHHHTRRQMMTPSTTPHAKTLEFAAAIGMGNQPGKTTSAVSKPAYSWCVAACT